MAARKAVVVTPELVKSKFGEFDFFLEKMNRSNREEFGYYLSAFLCAFRTFVEIAVRWKHGKNANQELQSLRSSVPVIGLLFEIRNIEAHQGSIRYWDYNSTVPRNMVARRNWGNQPLQSTGDEGLGQPPRYVFEGYGTDVFDTCKTARDEVARLLP